MIVRTDWREGSLVIHSTDLGALGEQLEEQSSAGIITGEDRCTASLGEKVQPLGEARHRGQGILAQLSPAPVLWRRSRSVSGGKEWLS